MPDRLLDDFPPISKQAWLDKIVSDLKGKPYEKLVRKTFGIAVPPVYTAEDLPEGVENSFPGQDDFRRGEVPIPKGSESWTVCQELSFDEWADVQTFLQGAGEDVDAVRIMISSYLRYYFSKTHGTIGALRYFHGLILRDWREFEPVFAWANANGKEVWMEVGDAAVDFLDKLPLDPNILQKGGLDFNPMDYRREGEIDGELQDQLFQIAAKALKKLHPESDFRLFEISMEQYELALAGPAQQIALVLAQAVALVAKLNDYGIAPEETFRRLSVRFFCGTQFFHEIAKVRAFRLLWSRVLEAWQLDPSDPRLTHVQATSGLSSQTIVDPHVNLLRHTTEVMAAVMGGCRLISLPAFDTLYTVPSQDSVRIARNIQLVLREESYLGRVMDPAGGAYFVESFTDAISEQAWGIFQTIEREGGWMTFVKNKGLQGLLDEEYRQQKISMELGAKPILGANVYANEREVLPEIRPTEFPYGESQVEAGMKDLKTTLGIDNRRMVMMRPALAFESYRMLMQRLGEEHPAIRKVLLLTFGDPALRAARANFSRSVLAAGGFICTENAHPDDLPASVEFAKKLKPRIIVLCGADTDYFQQGPEWLDALQAASPDALMILAGKPEGWETLKKNGLTEIVYAGINRIGFLGRIIKTLQMTLEGHT
jgi:methylmalonyl-CoA mutase